MGRTVGKRIRPGERARALCDYCGALWDRRKLRVDGAGRLVCPDEGPGRDGVTLSRLNAEHAQAWAERQGRHDPPDGTFDKETATAIPNPIAGVRTGTFS